MEGFFVSLVFCLSHYIFLPFLTWAVKQEFDFLWVIVVENRD